MEDKDLKFQHGFKAEVKLGKKVIIGFDDDNEIYTFFSEEQMFVKIISKTTKKEITLEFKK